MGWYVCVAVYCLDHVHHWHHLTNILRGERRRHHLLVVANDGHVCYLNFMKYILTTVLIIR